MILDTMAQKIVLAKPNCVENEMVSKLPLKIKKIT